MINAIGGRRGMVVLAAMSVALAVPTYAAEWIVRNDSVTGTSDGTPCTCFLPGEIPASWLTIPFDGTLVGVQVFWQSSFGGQPDSLEMAVNVYAGGTFPTPGAILSSVAGPTLADGVLNEFRFEDPPIDVVPISVPVTAGQSIVVGVEILNQSSGNLFAASASYDQDGCQASRNAVLTDPGGWVDACPQGVTGDWAIRAIVVPDNDIPAVSSWGLVAMALLLPVAGVVIRRRLLARSRPLSF